MIPTHKLIDREEPRCLYCNSECDIHLDGFAAATPSYNVDILTCRKCNENFEIYWLGDIEPIQTISFIFTCKDVAVRYDYDTGFLIGGHELLWKSTSRMKKSTLNAAPVEPFDVDFSDKKKLYKRLKTCLVFS